MSNDLSLRASEFYKAVLSLENEEECAAFFSDICTIQELEAFIQRLEVAKQLLNGNNYNDISKSVGSSTATICRVAKCIKYGDGGYSTVLSRINNGEEK